MSLETWKQQFYPTDAEFVPVERMARAAYRKWRGCTPYALAKHDVTFWDIASEMLLSDRSCTFCLNYYDWPRDGVFCPDCPLTQLGANCLGRNDTSDDPTPYDLARIRVDKDRNLRPLLRALKTIAQAEARGESLHVSPT